MTFSVLKYSRVNLAQFGWYWPFQACLTLKRKIRHFGEILKQKLIQNHLNWQFRTSRDDITAWRLLWVPVVLLIRCQSTGCVIRPYAKFSHLEHRQPQPIYTQYNTTEAIGPFNSYEKCIITCIHAFFVPMIIAWWHAEISVSDKSALFSDSCVPASTDMQQLTETLIACYECSKGTFVAFLTCF